MELLTRPSVRPLQSNRGGQVTYHGPGQLVAYPILDLVRFRQSLLWYTESLGAVMTEAVRACFGLDAFYDSCPDRVGLWLSDRGSRLLSMLSHVVH